MKTYKFNKNKRFLSKLFIKCYEMEDKKTWQTNKNKIELKLTDYCNLKCGNCNACMDVFQTDKYLSLEDMEEFVEESIRLDHKWKSIKLVGGEPTLHPSFFKVIEILNKYRKFYKKCMFILSTNGCGGKIRDIINRIPPWLGKIDSVDQTFEKKFDLFWLSRVAPIDLNSFKGYKDFDKGCWITQDCGLSKSVNGLYYPCTPSNVIDNIFGLGLGEKTIEDISSCNVKDKFKKLCRLCGHFLEPALKNGTEVIQTKTWDIAIEKYLREIKNE